MNGHENCPTTKKKYWTIDGKKTFAQLAMAEEPAKINFEVFPELTTKMH